MIPTNGESERDAHKCLLRVGTCELRRTPGYLVNLTFQPQLYDLEMGKLCYEMHGKPLVKSATKRWLAFSFNACY